MAYHLASKLPKDLLYIIQGFNVKYDPEKHTCYFLMRNNNLKGLKYLVSQGADVRAQRDYAVRLAAAKGHLSMVKYLVSHGADCRAYSDEAVRYAAENGHLEMVKYLQSQGADIRALDDYALTLAVYKGDLKMVKYLQSQGAKQTQWLAE
jgi:ankyrin repeat protein